MQVILKRKDHSEYITEIIGKVINLPHKQLILGTIRDISEHVRYEQELKKLNLAIEQSVNTVVITNPEGEIEYVNPKFTDFTGYTPEEVLGKTTRILKSGEQTKEFHSQLWATIKKGNIWKGEFHNKKKNGEFFRKNATITPVKNAEGEIVNYLSIYENITARKIAEQSIKNKNIELEKINAEKDKFFSIIGHDLRGPFSSIIGLLRILLNEKGKIKERAILETVLKSAENTFELLENLLDWSTAQMKGLDFSPQLIDMQDVL
ncbi:MAG: PAS domain S-box protein [Bacteroidota bacterium]|nr:PAS domain S-box protein [Bacteroidota bacterium]